MGVLLIPALFPALASLISFGEKESLSSSCLMIKPVVDVVVFASSSMQFTFASVLLWSGKGHFHQKLPIVRLPQWQWSNPEQYGQIDHFNAATDEVWELISKLMDTYGARAPSQYIGRLSRYVNFYCKDDTVVRPDYLYNVNSCTGKTASLYWDGPFTYMA